jgi:hypothetical protein
MPIISLGIIPTLSKVPGMKHFITCTLKNLVDTHDAIIESCMQQTYHANSCHYEDDYFAVGDLVYISTADLLLPKGQASKLLPKFIGPFKVLEAYLTTLSYMVELLTLFCVHNLHNKLHRSKLHPYHANNNMLLSHWEAYMLYDFGNPDDQEQLVDKILNHKWEKDDLMFQLYWNDRDTTWESYETCKDLQVLDEYLQLIRVKEPINLL